MLRLRSSETVSVPWLLRRLWESRLERSKVLTVATSRPQQGLHSPKASTPSRPRPPPQPGHPQHPAEEMPRPHHPTLKLLKGARLPRLSDQLSTAQEPNWHLVAPLRGVGSGGRNMAAAAGSTGQSLRRP